MTHNPHLHLQGHFSAAGSTWSIRSNSAAVLQSAAETFPALKNAACAELEIQIYMESGASPQSLWKVPQFRGRDQLVFADFGPRDRLLVDLLGRRAIGQFSPAVAADSAYWKRTIFPILLGVTGAALGITPLHCACLRYKGEGVLITGESGAGKSTLAFELARRGLEFISDDWTYFSRRGMEVVAWGLPTSIKLLPDCVSHFPELQNQVPVIHLNGELALELDPERTGFKRESFCRPTRVFLLDRQPGCGFAVSRLSADEIAEYLRQSLEKLPACLEKYRDAQLATILALCQTEAWYLRCGGSPQDIASGILHLCGEVPGQPGRPYFPLRVTRREWPDLLRRFVPLKLREQFFIRGHVFQIQSDSKRIMRALRGLAKPFTMSAPRSICWTIQEEPEWTNGEECSAGLATGGLSFLSAGGHSFVAFDRNTGQAAAFIGGANADAEIRTVLDAMSTHLIQEAASASLPISSGLRSAPKSNNRLRHVDA